jgi:SAM-dependent methyltransferase
VLDLSSREGYGAWLLAEKADSVVGLDVDAAVVQDAADKYKRDNLKFLSGSPVSVPITPDHTFDAVVCFDAIEDATNPQRLFSEIKRLLKPNGLLLVSVPNQSSSENLFGAKAFSTEQLGQLLKSHFSYVQQFKQALWANSIIQADVPTNNGAGPGEARARQGEASSKGEPQYLLAIASDSPIPSIATSTHADSAITVLREKEKALRALLDLKAYQDETIKRQERQLAERKHTLATLEEAFAWHTSKIDTLEKTCVYLEREIEQLRQNISSDRKALEWRSSQVASLETTIASRDEALAWRAEQVESAERRLQEQLLEHQRQIQEQAQACTDHVSNVERQLGLRIANLTEQIDAIHASRGWKLILWLRSIRGK